ncbi:MAG: carboxypeptidase regulatory-like domain-containing protein [Bacteroidetes bacterium]|nr:carboxypeptidase regulatory-like domain-containing protein [Bacteroidota bacterium]
MRKFFLILTVILLQGLNINAQSNQSGVVNGIITDDSTLAPIKGVHVYFMFANGMIAKHTETNSTGTFSFKLPTGVYYIYFKSERYGFEFYDNVQTFDKAKPIEVKNNDTINIKVGLKNNIPIVTLTPPKNLKATQVLNNWGTLVHLTWASATILPQPHYYIQYNVYRSDNISASPLNFKKITSANGNEFYDKTITKGAAYKYYLTSTIYEMESTPSDTVSISIKDSLVAGKGIISGVIIDDSTKQPIAKASFALIPTANFHCDGGQTKADGSFSMQVSEGSYYLYVKANEYNFEYYDNVQNLTSAKKIEVKKGDTLKLNIGLSKMVLRPKLTLNGSVKDISGVGQKSEIVAYRVKLNSKHYYASSTKSDSEGKFSMSVQEGDTVVVYTRPLDKSLLPEYYENKSNFNEATRIAVKSNLTIAIVVDKKPVYANGMSGIVNDVDSKPVASSISAIMIGGNTIGKRITSTLSDSLGLYGFTNLELGKYILFAKPTGEYKPTYYRADGAQTMDWRKADTITMSSTSIVTNLKFKLVKQSDTGHAIISGSIVNKNNLGVEGVTVFALDENNQVYSYAITNPSGFYFMNGLTSGTYKIVTDKVGYEPSTIPLVILNYENTTAMSKSGSIIINPITSDIKDALITVKKFELSQNYPNPFNPATSIKYSVPTSSFVKISVYDLIGREVKILTNQKHEAGSYSINFNATELPSGIFIYQLQSGKNTISRKMIYLK